MRYGTDSPWVMNSDLSAECRYCERIEKFEHQFEARVWLLGHLIEEHADDLPDFEGTA